MGADVWVVDALSDKVYRYANAAGCTSGSQNATSSFLLHANNTSPKDLVTDGNQFWVVDDQTLDRVYQYKLDGTYNGRWGIDPANASPTGITLAPTNPRHLWIVDTGTNRVYRYDYAVSAIYGSGSKFAATSYPLAAGNTNPQGIADPPAPVGAWESDPTVGDDPIAAHRPGTDPAGEFAPTDAVYAGLDFDPGAGWAAQRRVRTEAHMADPEDLFAVQRTGAGDFYRAETVGRSGIDTG